MIKVLKEYEIPVGELSCWPQRSAGQKITFDGREITVEEAAEDSFKGMDFCPQAVKNQCQRNLPHSSRLPGSIYRQQLSLQDGS